MNVRELAEKLIQLLEKDPEVGEFQVVSGFGSSGAGGYIAPADQADICNDYNRPGQKVLKIVLK